MAGLTRDDLDQLRQSLSADIADLRRDIDIRFAQVDAKLDAKPGFAALYQAVATLAFGISAILVTTIVVFKNLGLMG